MADFAAFSSGRTNRHAARSERLQPAPTHQTIFDQMIPEFALLGVVHGPKRYVVQDGPMGRWLEVREVRSSTSIGTLSMHPHPTLMYQYNAFLAPWYLEPPQ